MRLALALAGLALAAVKIHFQSMAIVTPSSFFDTHEVPQLQLEEPQLFLFLGGSPHAQLGYEQSFDSV